MLDIAIYQISYQYLIGRQKIVRTTKSLKKNTSSRAITQPKIIRPERNSNLNCNLSRYNHIPNIKSIYQRTLKKKSGQLKILM